MNEKFEHYLALYLAKEQARTLGYDPARYDGLARTTPYPEMAHEIVQIFLDDGWKPPE